MLENNSTRLIFAAIAVVVGGVIYGTANNAYPDLTNQIIKKIQAPFTDETNTGAPVTNNKLNQQLETRAYSLQQQAADYENIINKNEATSSQTTEKINNIKNATNAYINSMITNMPESVSSDRIIPISKIDGAKYTNLSDGDIYVSKNPYYVIDNDGKAINSFDQISSNKKYNVGLEFLSIINDSKSPDIKTSLSNIYVDGSVLIKWSSENTVVTTNKLPSANTYSQTGDSVFNNWVSDAEYNLTSEENTQANPLNEEETQEFLKTENFKAAKHIDFFEHIASGDLNWNYNSIIDIFNQ